MYICVRARGYACVYMYTYLTTYVYYMNPWCCGDGIVHLLSSYIVVVLIDTCLIIYTEKKNTDNKSLIGLWDMVYISKWTVLLSLYIFFFFFVFPLSYVRDCDGVWVARAIG